MSKHESPAMAVASTTQDDRRWYALPRQKTVPSKVQSRIVSRANQQQKNKQKQQMKRDFEYTHGSTVRQIKFVADMKNVGDSNRYPELVALGFGLFKSLSDHHKITLLQKKQNRERIKKKLNDKNNSQFQATARFETENDNVDSKSDLNNLNSPGDNSLKNLHELSIGGPQKPSKNSIGQISIEHAPGPGNMGTTNINIPSAGPGPSPNNKQRKSRQANKAMSMSPNVGGRQTEKKNAMAQRQSHQHVKESHSPIDVPVADRDFSITTESIQSSALKSTKMFGERSHNRTDPVKKDNVVRKVTIDEERSTPQDSQSPRDGVVNPGGQNGEPAVQFSKKNTIRRFQTLKNEDNSTVALRKAKKTLPEGESEPSDARKLKPKRGKTQKGDPGKAFPVVETSENGITLCKISESCLEELSIVESQDLYGSEAPDQRQREYDDRIQRRIQEGRQYLIDRQRNNQSKANLHKDSKSQTTDMNTKSVKKREHASEKKPTARKYQIIISKSNEPRAVLEMNKNQGNTKQNVFFKQLNRNGRRPKAAGPPSDFISIGSSSDVRQSQLGNNLGRSQMERLSLNSRARKDKRDGSSFYGSNYSSHSGATSIKKSQQNEIILNKSFGKKAAAGHNRTRRHANLQSTPVKPGSVPRNTEGLLSSDQSPLLPQDRRSRPGPRGSHPSSRGRGQSLTKQASAARPKLPSLRPRDSQKKKNVFSKELAQVTEKEEYEYSPMKSNVTHDNPALDAMQKKELKRRGNDFQDLDNELLIEKHGKDEGDFYLQKVQSNDDSHSHQFEDSLLEQSSPNVDIKDLPYAHDQNSMAETTTNIQLCNASGSYRVQQVTLSSREQRRVSELPKRKVSPKKKRAPKSNQWKDGNFKNLKEHLMFIPNQPSVSQVQGKTKMYLAASEVKEHPSAARQSARRLTQQSDIVNMLIARDRTSFRAHMNNSMTAGQSGSRKLSPSDSKAERLNSKNPTGQIHRSVFQPQNAEVSLSEVDNLTGRPDDRQTFRKMLTQKTDASKKASKQAPSSLKKQNTQHLARNEKYQSNYQKQFGKAERHERTTDQMTSAWKDRGDDISFPGQSFEQLNKYKKAKSLAKPKKVERSASKNAASQSKGRLPSRTGGEWHPSTLQAADGEVDYLCNIAIIGQDLEQDNSLNDRKQEAADQASQQSHLMRFYPSKEQATQHNYSSIHSQSKLNRKSMDSLSNKNFKAPSAVQDGNLYFQGALSVVNAGNPKQQFTQSAQKSDLPQVAKLTYSVPKRQKQNAANYAGQAVLPGHLMPSIVNSGKPQKTPRGRNDKGGWQVKKIVSHTQRPANQSLFELIQGLAVSANPSWAGKVDRHPTDSAEASPPNGGLLYYNDLFSGELRTRQLKDTKYTPKIDGGRRRIGSYGQANGFGDGLVRNKKSTESKQPSQGNGSWQQMMPSYAPSAGETAQGVKFAQTMAKMTNPPKSRDGSTKGGPVRPRPTQGDPYAIPLHYLRAGADPKHLTTKTHSRLTHKFVPKSMKGVAASPFRASAANQMSRSPDPLALRPQPVPGQRGSYFEGREAPRTGYGQRMLPGNDLVTAPSELMTIVAGAGSVGAVSSSTLANKQRRLRPIDSMEREKGASLQPSATAVLDSKNNISQW